MLRHIPTFNVYSAHIEIQNSSLFSQTLSHYFGSEEEAMLFVIDTQCKPDYANHRVASSIEVRKAIIEDGEYRLLDIDTSSKGEATIPHRDELVEMNYGNDKRWMFVDCHGQLHSAAISLSISINTEFANMAKLASLLKAKKHLMIKLEEDKAALNKLEKEAAVYSSDMRIGHS
jgi:hypothetical protein